MKKQSKTPPKLTKTPSKSRSNSKKKPTKEEKINDDILLNDYDIHLLSREIDVPSEMLGPLKLARLQHRPDHKIKVFMALSIEDIPGHEKLKTYLKIRGSTFTIVMLEKHKREITLRNLYGPGIALYQITNKWSADTLKAHFNPGSFPPLEEEPHISFEREIVTAMSIRFKAQMDESKKYEQSFETYMLGIFLRMISEGCKFAHIKIYLVRYKMFSELAVLLNNENLIKQFEQNKIE